MRFKPEIAIFRRALSRIVSILHKIYQHKLHKNKQCYRCQAVTRGELPDKPSTLFVSGHEHREMIGRNLRKINIMKFKKNKK